MPPIDIGTQLAEALRKLEARVSKQCMDAIVAAKPFQAWALGKDLELARQVLRLWDGPPEDEALNCRRRAGLDAELEMAVSVLHEEDVSSAAEDNKSFLRRALTGAIPPEESPLLTFLLGTLPEKKP